MTTSTEQLDTVPTEILDAVPEHIKEEVRQQLAELTECLGERWIGGPWLPQDDNYREKRTHTQSDLDDMGVKRRDDLAASLRRWSAHPDSDRVHLFLYLWQECWQLWDAYLVYRTLQVVETAVAEVTHAACGGPAENRESAAWRAVGRAISLITADAGVFRQIALSDPAGLVTYARRGTVTAETVIIEIRAALDCLDHDADANQLTTRGLRYVERVALENQFLYEFLAAAAKALTDFQHWVAKAPRLRTARLAEKTASGDGASVQARRTLKSVDGALEQLRSDPGRLSGIVLSRAEPWEQLLEEIREILTQEGGQDKNSQVFVPRRVSIRYCYPFAVETDESASDTDERTSLERRLRRHDLVKAELGEKLNSLGLGIKDVRPLDPTAFFAARGSENGLYGGLRVDLPDIEISSGRPGGQPARCGVWIVLSRMGNHCLCVEREVLDTPLPQVVYQAIAVGTPFVFGVTTAPVDSATVSVAWDNLHSFGRDVIRAIACAGFWRPGQDHAADDGEQYMRGNLHEVLVTWTDGPLGVQSADIADKLNSALGGRILLKSVQRAATTIDEWVRYPPAAHGASGGDVTAITSLPELGLAGDWCAHTGETTVFGIVAAPSWHSNMYAEAAQFADSWAPLLRLWNRRLHSLLSPSEAAGPDTGNREDTLEDTGRRARALHQVELIVRRHLAQIKAEELCATLAHRRFLDRLLEMSGVARLQEELESQLVAAERLMDWWSEDARRDSEKKQRKSDQRRDKLLGVIALFGMFEIGTFLGLANATNWHQSFFGLFTLGQGVWEDWLMVTLFVVALLAGYYFGFFGLDLRPRRAPSLRHDRQRRTTLSRRGRRKTVRAGRLASGADRGLSVTRRWSTSVPGIS